MIKMNYVKAILLFFTSLTLLAFSLSCSKSQENKVKQAVNLDKKNITLKVGDQAVITASFDTGAGSEGKYQWVSINEEVATVQENENWSATITAVGEGSTVIRIRSADGQVSASCEVKVTIVQTGDLDADGVIRILAIGNSFSEDAIEHHLYGLAQAGNIPAVIGNLYIGGASLSVHWQNASNNSANYSYRKIDVGGTKTVTENMSIATALVDEPWDYVSFQQASPNSGQYETYVTPLPLLYNYVKSTLNRPHAKYIFHQTWAYAQNSTYAPFVNYGNDQMVMYQAIISAVNQATQLVYIDVVVPAGTAIQNGRTSVIGDNFCRDGYHLDVNIGRYTAAATWYEALFGKSVIGNTYKPAALSDYEAEIAQHAASHAVSRPDAVTIMENYQSWPGSGTDFSDIFIDFSNSSSSEGWNAFTSVIAGFGLSNLKDMNGYPTGIKVELLERFNGHNASGPSVTSTSFNMPGAVSSTSYYGNPKLTFNGQLIEQSVLKFGGLDKDRKYSFCFFGSRIDNSATDNRETSYKVSGQNEKTVLLNTLNNTSEVICADSMSPTATGEITVTVTAGSNNTNQYGFYYLTAMKISVGD